jgi:hypothetical protein
MLRTKGKNLSTSGDEGTTGNTFWASLPRQMKVHRRHSFETGKKSLILRLAGQEFIVKIDKRSITTVFTNLIDKNLRLLA